MSCIRKPTKEDSYGFKNVPGSLVDITAEWCEMALKIEPPKNPVITTDVSVTSIDIQHLKNEDSGAADGGGLSGSELVRITPTYAGNITGNEPSSFVCKLSHGSGNHIAINWRFVMYLTSGGEGYDEYMYRRETNFLKRIIPIMDSALYKFPNMYFYGIEDKGDRGFGSAVIMDNPVKVKSVILMEDMNGWKSATVGSEVTKDMAILCLENVAVLHAKLWGNHEIEIKNSFKPAKTEMDFRSASHNALSKKFRKFNFRTEKIQKAINKVVNGDWKTSRMLSIDKDCLVPDWLTAEPLEDGFRPVFSDPLVLEMLGVLAVKVPNYNNQKLKHLVKKPPQTILHGDFHGGNHMFGVNENAGKIVAFDYQWAGTGRVATEFMYFFMTSISAHSLEDVMECAEKYHQALCKNGVEDYHWDEFKEDIEMMIVELCVLFFQTFTMMKAKTLLKFADGFGEKGEALKAIFETGMYGKFYIILTSIYLKDKENFLAVPDKM